MKEKELAKNLVNDAITYFEDYQKGALFPSIVIDKEEYKKYNINELSNELNLLDFQIVDMKNAPTPYNEVPIAFKKWFIYKPIN